MYMGAIRGESKAGDGRCPPRRLCLIAFSGSPSDYTKNAQGTRRFVTPTESVAAARSKVAPEMFRAITRTVLFDHTAASSSRKRVDDTSDDVAGSPARTDISAHCRASGQREDQRLKASARPAPTSTPPPARLKPRRTEGRRTSEDICPANRA